MTAEDRSDVDQRWQGKQAATYSVKPSMGILPSHGEKEVMFTTVSQCDDECFKCLTKRGTHGYCEIVRFLIDVTSDASRLS
ncbi:hypothetical protein AK812_SmicGene23480 [Symbiodinium microadriaticum]|uniref:Uncharacterized protein n=1 Tax=Symbiodinium microadriaticum TaxID=2951 RepID=A0A1Q9DH48_SYMMI|nr:hypothetical protein AK812_SmicGene23480 [Symbiodinium microadriaticum]